MEREAKDHASLTGNDLRNILERKNQEPSALPACADDEVAGAILVPAELLDYAEQPLRRFDTEAHALGQVATKPLSPWCCSAPSFHPTPFPESGEAERLMKPTGWLPPSQFGVAPPPKALALVRLAEGAFFPRSSALGPSAPRVCASPTNGSRADFGNCDSLNRGETA